MLPVTEMGPSSDATIRKPNGALNRLPAASEVEFPYPARYAWLPVSTKTLAAALHLDRGLFATWRCRGIGPAELPSAWFRRASGSPRYYMVADILTWLAARRGEPLDRLTAWRHSLAREFGHSATDPHRVRGQVHLYASTARGVVGDVRFTPNGWRDYLASLLVP